MRTITHVWQAAIAVLKQFDIDTPVIDARLLVQQALGITREQLLMQPKHELTDSELKAFEALLERRLAREPMSHIIGRREFYGLDFKVTGDVLTPRPDSETVVDAVLEWINEGKSKPEGEEKLLPLHPTLSPFRLLDLGTGTGCLLLTLLHLLPHMHGTGVDISPQAIAIAHENAKTLGLAARAEFHLSNWCEKISGQFNIIVANPPYIASNEIAALMPEVADYEPHLALDGGEDGLACYRLLARQLPPFMAKKAVVALEIGAGQEKAVAEIFHAEGFHLASTRRDLAGIPRCLMFTLYKDVHSL